MYSLLLKCTPFKPLKIIQTLFIITNFASQKICIHVNLQYGVASTDKSCFRYPVLADVRNKHIATESCTESTVFMLSTKSDHCCLPAITHLFLSALRIWPFSCNFLNHVPLKAAAVRTYSKSVREQ